MLILYIALIIFVILQFAFLILFVRSLEAKKRIQESLMVDKCQYKSLFEDMQEGFALLEIVCDGAGKPVYSRFINVNKAFENIIGLKREEIISKTLLEIFPEKIAYWDERFREVALTGKATYFEYYSNEIEGYYYVNVFNPEKGKCAVTFFNATENKIQQEVLICITKQLEALDGLKDKLFAVLSHDIRNPMATMVSMMEVLEGDYYSSDNNKIVHEVRKQVKKTFLVVESQLEWLNDKKNGSNYRYIYQMAQKTVNVLQNITESKEIRIINNVEDSVVILVDKEIIWMALQSLFNTAVKFFRNGELISIKTKQAGRKVIVAVRATGIHIDSDQAKTLFNEANEGSAAFTLGEKETGLGILICKDLIQCDGGEVWMNSILQKCNTFYFSLPSERKENIKYYKCPIPNYICYR